MENQFKSGSTAGLKPRLESCEQSELEKSHSKDNYTPFQDLPTNTVELNTLHIEETVNAIYLAYYFIGDDDRIARKTLESKINELNEIRSAKHFGINPYNCFYQVPFQLEYKFYNKSRAMYYIDRTRPLGNDVCLQVLEYDKDNERHKIYSIILLTF